MQWLFDLLSGYRAYFFTQVAFEIIVYLLGIVVLISSLISDKSDEKSVKNNMSLSAGLAFIVGMSLFVLTGYVLLITGIYYCTLSVTIPVLLLLLIFVLWGIKRKSFVTVIRYIKPVHIVFVLATVVILACISASGMIAISVSNDSLYYFWQYPRAIVQYGGLRDQFDNFMTDTGIGAATIGTLPFLYGFGETFGIQEFFHLSFSIFLGKAMNDTLKKECPNLKGGKSICISIITVLLFMTATPTYIISHWAMANMYFMELFFVGLYLMSQLGENGDCFIVSALILIFCSAMRMEGGIFILFLILAASLVCKDKKKLALSMLPVVILQSAFELKIFLMFNIDNPYLFLTPGKALIQFAAYIFVIIYLIIVSGRAEKIMGTYIAAAYMVVLVLVNIMLAVIDAKRYIANIRAFIGNLFGQSGWGIFPYVIIGSFAIVAVIKLTGSRQMCLQKTSEKISVQSSEVSIDESKAGNDFSRLTFWLFSALGFVLITLAVSFARGDEMYVDTGDSGNRVLLQIVPLLVFSLVLWVVKNIYESEKKS